MATVLDDFDFFLSKVNHNLREVTDFTLSYLSRQFDEILKQSESHLLQAARELNTEEEKERLISAISECQNKHLDMQTIFIEKLMGSLGPLTGKVIEVKLSLADANPAGLVDDTELEDKIFIQTIEAHAHTHFEKWMTQITTGLKMALPGVGITEKNNPLGPTIIGDALYAAVQSTNMTTSARQEIFRLFEQQLFHKLEVFYKEILVQLSKSGVAVNHPGSQMAIRPSDSTAIPIIHHGDFKPDAVEEIATQKHSDTFNDYKDDTVINEWDVIDVIQGSVIPEDLNQLSYINLEEQAKLQPEKVARTLSRDALDELLAYIQKGYDPSCDGELMLYIKKQLLLEADEGQIIILRESHENIINLLSLTFDRMSEDQDDKIIGLIRRLKIPYIRLALNEDLFFHDSQHSSRQLLDALLLLISKSSGGKEQFKHVQNIVMKVLLRYDVNKNIFSDLLATVESYIKQESLSKNENHHNTTAECETEEKQRLAQKAVKKLIEKYLQKLNKRLRFHELLACYWEKILADIHRQKSTDSEEWETAIYLLVNIVLTTGGASKNELKGHLKDLPVIAKSLSQFLSDHQVSMPVKQVFLNQLQEIQIQLVRGGSINDLDDRTLTYTGNINVLIEEHQKKDASNIEVMNVGSDHSSNTLKLIEETRRPSLEAAQDMVDKLAIGQWMNFVVENKALSCQVGFYSSSQKSYTFFDRQHQKLFDRNREKIAEDLHHGFAGMLDSSRHFSDILAEVISAVNRRQA